MLAVATVLGVLNEYEPFGRRFWSSVRLVLNRIEVV
jgi:hypothetical protein